MSVKMLDTCRKSEESLLRSARLLNGIGESFLVVGNYRLGEQLIEIADSIRADTTNIAKAVSDDISEQYNLAQQSSISIIKTVLGISDDDK